MSYLSYWHQIEEGMQGDPAQQSHGGQRVPQLLGGGKDRGPLEHTGLRGSTHTDQEEDRQGKKDGNAYGTWEMVIYKVDMKKGCVYWEVLESSIAGKTQ